MALASFSIAGLFVALLWGVSARFRPRFAAAARVPMQWGFDGKPTWYASPKLALAFTPLLGTAALILIAVLSSFATPSSGQRSSLAVLTLVGALFVGIHFLHLRFAKRQTL